MPRARCVLFWGLLFQVLCGCAYAETRARVLFIGDVMAHKEQLEAARGKDGSWDFAPQFRRVRPLFQEALVVANLETVFAGEARGFAGYPSFNTPDSLAGAMADLGVRVATVANNHILDRGFSGAARTVAVLESADLLWTGLSSGDIAPNSALGVDYAGLKWAFVAYSYGSNRVLTSGDVLLNILSDAAVVQGLADARQLSPDLTVACFHWGNEYQHQPTQRQRAIAALAFENGADVVIGTHPHVLQPVEMVSTDRGYGTAVYSLGNFVSFQRTLPRERSGVLALDVLKASGDLKARVTRVSIAPTRVSATHRNGHRLIEVVYSGESARFNHAGLPVNELKTAQEAGRRVLDFLGALDSADALGFYTLWDATSPDVLPKGRRKTPH